RLKLEMILCDFFFVQAEDGIRDRNVTGVQTCALPIYSEEKQLLAVGLTTFNGRYSTDYGGLFAATTISIIPVLIIYIIFQKRFEIGRASCREEEQDLGVHVLYQ